ncbi:subtilisin-like protein [Thozetella sp. PMI_491]|nr:subtilisin-like protein [Thozetella sp. PMI_491]
MRSLPSLLLPVLCFRPRLASAWETDDRAFIITLSSDPVAASLGGIFLRSADHHEFFHQRAAEASISYTVQHEFDSVGPWQGISVRASGDGSVQEFRDRLGALEGVVAVTPVKRLSRAPGLHKDEFADGGTFAPYANANGNLQSTLEMGGVDKLHALGIKGKGMKIGIVDTGIDYRHPALGGGFGPGFKVAGGGALINQTTEPYVWDPDPLQTCLVAGHGTHVAGIIGMDPLPSGEGFNISGVAPEAELYMYKIFDCNQQGGTTDQMIAALLKAQQDRVDIVSMSLSEGVNGEIDESFNGVDPMIGVIQQLHDAGIAVVIANGNAGGSSAYAKVVYKMDYPADAPGAFSIGSITNKDFPLVYAATDSYGSQIPYASLWPMGLTGDVDVFFMESDACSTSSWTDAVDQLEGLGMLNTTVIAYYVNDGCLSPAARPCCNQANTVPLWMMALSQGSSNVAYADYQTDSAGWFGNAQQVSVHSDDTPTFINNYNAAGGFGKYKLNFDNQSFASTPQLVGGLVDYYTSGGPVYRTYDMKPDISAPGGVILSTFPLWTPLGNYTVLSGTSMATPYASGCYALIKSQFPEMSVDEIVALLQTTAKPVVWEYNTAMLSGTYQQGAGLINVYQAYVSKSKSVVTPGELLITDNSRTVFGKANITIENKSNATKTYWLSHKPAALAPSVPTGIGGPFPELAQLPVYASVDFPVSKIQVSAGDTTTITFDVIPPEGAVPAQVPIMGGYIQVNSCGEKYSVPYCGPAYSLYNAKYLVAIPNVLPYIRFTFANGTEADDWDIATVDSTTKYYAPFTIQQSTLFLRAFLLPANTTIDPTYLGFNSSITHDYVSSTTAPPETVFGVASYGLLSNQPNLQGGGASYYVQGSGVATTLTDGTSFQPGPGDYRWLVAVTRWGGDPDVFEDNETWLSAVVRFAADV